MDAREQRPGCYRSRGFPAPPSGPARPTWWCTAESPPWGSGATALAAGCGPVAPPDRKCRPAVSGMARGLQNYCGRSQDAFWRVSAWWSSCLASRAQATRPGGSFEPINYPTTHNVCLSGNKHPWPRKQTPPSVAPIYVTPRQGRASRWCRRSKGHALGGGACA